MTTPDTERVQALADI